MKRQSVVLVADRNPRIRDFVQRELLSEGHRVFTAENTGQLKSWFLRPVQLDALVIDPNMPGIDNYEEIRSLLSLRPGLPVVFHCLVPDRDWPQTSTEKVRFVEKGAQSVDAVKAQIVSLLASKVSV